MFDKHHVEATPGARSACPSCDGPLIAKCGSILAHHWAHVAADCDPWSEPESQWHLTWKQWFLDHRDANVEVVLGRHRADVVLPSGKVVELQADYLNADQIADRESYYGRNMMWLYRCHWRERLHFGRKGFWWKWGSKSMARHRRPVWWDVGGELWLVDIDVASNGRVLGRVLKRKQWLDGRVVDNRSEAS